MDYIITDAQTSPLKLASQYSEKLAYMPNTFFIGDHKQMFPHLKERIILKDHSKLKIGENGHVADNHTVINTIDKRQILEKADIKQISQVSMVGENKDMEVEIKVTVAQLPSSNLIDTMIQNGQVQTSVNGLIIQNGLTTNLASAKVIQIFNASNFLSTFVRQKFILCSREELF